MAEEVGTAYVGLLPSLRGFSSSLRRQLAAELGQVIAPIEQAGGKAGRAFGDNMHQGISSRLAGIGATIKTGLAVAVAAAGAGLAAITGFGLQSAAALEQTQIGFESLLGSKDDAQKFIGELQEFSKTTPFEFQGVANASRRILAFGQSVGITRDQIIPTITTIGDLAAVLGVGQNEIDGVVRALGQIASKGKVSQEELLQIAEQFPGFNANAAIAAATGLSVADSMEAITRGEVDAVTGINALLQGMKDFNGAAGAMEKQSQSLLGIWSTFKDTVSLSLTTAFQPAIPAIKDTLGQLTPIIGEAFDALGPALGNTLTALMPLLGQVVQGVVPILTPVLSFLSGALGSLAESGALESLGKAFGALLKPLEPLGPLIGDALGMLASEIVPILTDPALTARFEDMLDALLPILPTVLELVPPLLDLSLAMMPLSLAAQDLLLALLPLLVPLVKLVAVTADFLANKAIAPLIQLIADYLLLWVGPLNTVVGLLQDLGHWLAGIDWGGVASSIGGGFAAAWSAVAGFFGDIWRWLTDLPGQVRARVSSAGSWLVEAGRDIVRGLWNGITSLGGWLWSQVGDFVYRNTVGRVESLLGIHSPSTVFAGIGEDVVAGYVQGIEASARQASLATAAALTPAAAATGRAGMAVAPAAVPVELRSSSALMQMFIDEARDAIRRAYGGNAVLALSTTPGQGG